MENTLTSHFWLGRFPDERRVMKFFREVWDPEDEDRDHTPLSEFGATQGVKWYDHDFLEHGFKQDAATVAELVRGHSYHEQYCEELSARAVRLELAGLNTFVFIDHEQIRSPHSVKTDTYELNYLGTISYRSEHEDWFLRLLEGNA